MGLPKHKVPIAKPMQMSCITSITTTSALHCRLLVTGYHHACGALAVEPSSCLTSPYVGVGGPTIARSRSTPQGVHRAPAVAPYRRLHGTMCVKPSCLGCIDRSVPCMLASRDSVWPSEPLSIPNGATCLPSLVLTPWHATLWFTLVVWLIETTI